MHSKAHACRRRSRKATDATDPVVVGLGRLLPLIGGLLLLGVLLLWWVL